MPTIDTTTATRPVITPTNTQSDTLAKSLTDGKSGGIGGLNDFLKLLTTQMKNQDPLNPQEATEFVAQLASFSSVEQQINTNTNLQTLISKISGSDVQNLASYIGLDVSATGAGFQHESGTPVAIRVPGDLSAERVSVEIKDAQNQLVAIVPATSAGGNVTWNGKDINNQDVVDGRYSMTYVYKKGPEDNDSVRVDAEGKGQVVKARLDGEDVVLTLDTGAEIKTDDILSVQSSGV